MVVSSKVVAIGEGRCVQEGSVASKDELAIQESTKYLPRENVPNSWAMHTLSRGVLSRVCGIDTSNGNGYYILLPKNSHESAKLIRNWIQKHYGIESFGVVVTDSHSTPLRRGAIGLALGYAGFAFLKDYRGTKDLFGRLYKMSTQNIPDSLAAAATLVMGEGNECTPLALITDIPGIIFTEKDIKKEHYDVLEVPIEHDVFRPFLEAVEWKNGGGEHES